MKQRLSLISLILFLALTHLSPGQAQETNSAGLVVQSGDGTMQTFCISFSEETINGYELLQRSGLEVVAATDALGAAVCKIGADGCPAEDCFCDSPPNYWSYWHLDNGSWTYSPLGSGTYTIQDGYVDGWAWGDGSPPALVTFEEICSTEGVALWTATFTPDVSSATSTATYTSTQPPPTDTPAPTLTSQPTDTLHPTDSPQQPTGMAQPTDTPRLPADTQQPTATTKPTETPQPSDTPMPPTAIPASATATTIPPTPTKSTEALAKAEIPSKSETPTEASLFPPKHTLAVTATRIPENSATPTITNQGTVARTTVLGMGILAYLAFGALTFGLVLVLGVILILSRR